MDIGRRAGEHHAIDQRQQRRHLVRIGERKHDRLRLRADLDRARVLVAQQQKWHGAVVLAQQAVVCRHPNEGNRGDIDHVAVHSAGRLGAQWVPLAPMAWCHLGIAQTVTP